jgi:hypothetical protein
MEDNEVAIVGKLMFGEGMYLSATLKGLMF